MSKVTSKLQVTVPKSIADRFNIKPGDSIEWEAAGEIIRVVPRRKRAKSVVAPQDRLQHFDRATKRQSEREVTLDPALLAASAKAGRGWKRSDLYDRGGAS
jgi:AbrB family looped-hinge helix DNA binding protein